MPSKKRSGLDHRAYRRAKNKLRAESNICHLCGGHIDTRKPEDGGPAYGSKEEWTADHIKPRSQGGHLLGEMKAAHRECNSARGAKPIEQGKKLPTSRVW